MHEKRLGAETACQRTQLLFIRICFIIIYLHDTISNLQFKKIPPFSINTDQIQFATTQLNVYKHEFSGGRRIDKR